MKKIFLPFVILLLLSITINAQEKYTVNKSESNIDWKGFKPTGNHYGNIGIQSGYFTAKDGQIVSGEFVIDMNDIIVVDIPADSESNAKLTKHLKGSDFFDSKKYPTATFQVTGTEKNGDKTLIKGNLKIKDKTNPISFSAAVAINGNDLVVKSGIFKIDRSKWDIQYKSKSFFDNLADKFIYDDMEISIDIKSTK